MSRQSEPVHRRDKAWRQCPIWRGIASLDCHGPVLHPWQRGRLVGKARWMGLWRFCVLCISM